MVAKLILTADQIKALSDEELVESFAKAGFKMAPSVALGRIVDGYQTGISQEAAVRFYIGDANVAGDIAGQVEIEQLAP